jgi:D-lyxose ketol-isomerase
MKRSEINCILQEAIEFCNEMNFKLPPFAFWLPREWKSKGHEYDEIRDNALGWDITDFGMGNFKKIGLALFTLRNGNLKIPKYSKSYCEKLLIINEQQATPYHFHWNKMEDLINRGRGNLVFKLFDATEDERLADTSVTVMSDGRHYTVTPGSPITLRPGESISIPPWVYHTFWAEQGNG